MKRSFSILISGIWILTSGFSPAIIDTNNNGVSDLWEKAHNNGNLFTTFSANADPDSDGWTNAQEATAGTDPFDANAPAGFLRPAINHIPAVYLPPEEEGGAPFLATPEAVTLTWPTVAGKQYTLLFSADLSSGSWFPVGDPRIGNGTEMGNGIPLTQPDGSTPASVFWRVRIEDVDTDVDSLTNAEEAALGTDANNIDSDDDGLADGEEIALSSNPNNSNSDNDSFPDGEDADPAEVLVNWEKAPDATYLLIEVEVPEDAGDVQDLNDKAEILFGNGIWTGGAWIPKVIPEITGVYPDSVSTAFPEGIPYRVVPGEWSCFNDDRKLLQVAYIQPTDGPGVDSAAPCPMFWPAGQSSASLIFDTADRWDPIM